MNVLRRFDGWLIAHVFQAVVDYTQKAAAWWVEQCSFLLLLGNVASILFRTRVFNWWDCVVLVACVALSASFFVASRVEPLLRTISEMHFARWWVLATTVVLTPITWLGMNLAQVLSDVMFSIGMVGAYYFSCCAPPRPREPRGKYARGSA